MKALLCRTAGTTRCPTAYDGRRLQPAYVQRKELNIDEGEESNSGLVIAENDVDDRVLLRGRHAQSELGGKRRTESLHT